MAAGAVGKKALEAINELVRRGVSPNEIYRKTGYKRGIDGNWAVPAAVGVGAAGQSEETEAAFIGKAAKTFNKAAHRYAKRLEDAGAPRERIWQETGEKFGTPMYRGPEGKWRQEISDEAARLSGDDYTELAKEAALRGDMDEARRLLAEKESYEMPYKRRGVQDLGEVLSHRDLYDAYPELMDVQYQMTGQHGIGEGSFAPSKGVISVGEGTGSEPAKGVIMHEGQHAIQEREGFARGGGLADFQGISERAELMRDAEVFAKELRSKMKEHPNADLLSLENMVIEEYRQMDAMDWLPSREARNEARQPYMLRPDLYPDVYDKEMRPVIEMGLDKRATPRTSREAYQRLAGEAEARNVQARLPMTMQERIARPPWSTLDVPESELITRLRMGLPIATTGGLIGLEASPDSAMAASTGTIEAPAAPWLVDAANYMRRLELPIVGRPLEGLADWAEGAAYQDPDRLKRAAIGALDLM